MPDIFISNPLHPTPKHIPHLTSFCEMPLGVSFQNQEEDETILLFLRRHFITNVSWLLITLILVLVPVFFSIFNLQPLIFNALNFPSRFTTVSLIFYYLIVFNYFFINFITWFYNISLVTQKRVVDIDFSDLVYHDVAVTKLNLIEDTNYTQTGFIRTLFNYGDLFVQTAGEKNNFEALAIPKPAAAVDIIQDLIGKGHHAG